MKNIIIKKVILLAPTPPPAGGIAAWTIRMLNSQLSDNWKIEVVDEKMIDNDTFGDNSKRSLYSEFKRTFRIFKGLIIKLKDNDSRIVHSCIPSTTFAMLRESICMVITHLFGRKFIIHFRCTVPITTTTRSGKYILKFLTKKSDYIIVLNSHSKACIKQLCNTPIVIIPNFIEDSEIIEKKKTKNDIRKILYVGGVIESKGCLNICKVAMINKHIEFRLVGQPEKKIIEFVKNNSLSNVVLTGEKNKSDVKKELLEADVFIFLSYFKSEGFSNALVEAMGYGLPCIATKWAANEDMIESSGGYIIPTNDYLSVVKALKKMEDYKVRESMSKWNILKVKEKYSSKVILSQYVEVYNILTD